MRASSETATGAWQRQDVASAAGLARLTAETGLREGDVPVALDDALVATPTYAITHDAFLLTLPTGLRFYYRQGEGCSFAREPHVSDAEITLFFNGSVYGAIAWINGLVPLHASSVLHDGRVHAFTGISGAGKSTLVAALAAEGFTVFSDDVLVLDLSDPAQIVGLPGHKQLKLWEDALALTGRSGTRRVRNGLDKYYADDVAFASLAPMPVVRLYMLRSKGEAGPLIAPVTGMARLNEIRAAYYRPHFCAAIVENRNFFATASRIGQALDLHLFQRPRDKALFADGVAMIAEHIRSAAA